MCECFACRYVHTYVCACCLRRSEEAFRASGIEVIDGCALPCGWWYLNLDLQQQQVFLTTDPSLQPLNYKLWKKDFILLILMRLIIETVKEKRTTHTLIHSPFVAQSIQCSSVVNTLVSQPYYNPQIESLVAKNIGGTVSPAGLWLAQSVLE